MNPQTARLRFRCRTLLNVSFVVGIFIILAFVFAPLPFRWIADAIMIIVLVIFFHFVLEQRVIGILCPHCSKHIETNTPWICGFCEKKNEDGVNFPFVNACRHCGAEAKAYKCHHNACGKLIFLSRDELEANYARCLNVAEEPSPAPPTETEPDEEKWQKEKRQLEHQIIIAELSSKLEAVKKRGELDRKYTPRERLEKSFEEHHASTLGAKEIAREKRKEIAERFKDDPEMLKAAEEAIQDWIRREI